jgi:hypothetical protein
MSQSTKIVTNTEQSKPPRAGMGRPKGAKNKLTKKVKDAIETAFVSVGAAEYLEKVAKDDPKTFCALLGKVLPMQVTGEDGDPIEQEIIIRIVDPS